jgi:hypothetical protein
MWIAFQYVGEQVKLTKCGIQKPMWGRWPIKIVVEKLQKLSFKYATTFIA